MLLRAAEGGIRTHAPVNRPKAFRVPPLGPLEYFCNSLLASHK